MLAAVRALAASVPALAPYAHATALGELPVIDRQAVGRNPDRFRCARHRDGRPVWRKRTSGSSGRPLTCWYAADFYAGTLAMPLRQVLEFAAAPALGDHPVFSITVHCHLPGDDVIVDPLNQVGLMLSVSVDEREPATVERALDLVRRLRPRCLAGTPYVLDLLARGVRDLGTSPVAPSATIVCTGAYLDERVRASLTRSLGDEVINAYGMSEFGLVGIECGHRRGFHADEGNLLLEVLDHEGNPAEDGVDGELAISSTANAAMPLLRYRTGDTAKLEDRPCPCGRASRRIVGEFGQRIPCWRFGAGAELIPTELHELYSVQSVKRFQVTQTGLDCVEVLVDVGTENPASELLGEVRARVRRRLPAGVRVIVAAANLGGEHNLQRYRSTVTR
jgi:phenylacetate-CoA ligase